MQPWFHDLLRVFKSRADIDRYLQLSCSNNNIAVIKVGGAILTNELSTLVGSIHLMHRAGLCPVIVHGGGPQLNGILLGKGIEPNYCDGIRITDEKTLSIAKNVCFVISRMFPFII